MNPLQQRSIHESGHALVAHLLGEEITGVSARKDPYGQWGGLTKLARPEEVTTERIRDRLAVLMAGEVADLYAGADDEFRAWSGSLDRQDAQRFAEAISPKNPSLAVGAARTRAVMLIAAHWRVVQSFAEDLAQRMSMNGPCAHVLLEQALRKYGVDPEVEPGLRALEERLERQMRPQLVLLEEFQPLTLIRRIA